MKNSGKRGTISSECEVANISPFGVWILVSDREYFLDHKRFPWFKEASVEQVLAVESPRKDHLRWPLLDLDLHVDSLEHPERYPLTAKSLPDLVREPTVATARKLRSSARSRSNS